MKTRGSRRRSVLQICYMNKLFVRTCAGREREKKEYLINKRETFIKPRSITHLQYKCFCLPYIPLVWLFKYYIFATFFFSSTFHCFSGSLKPVIFSLYTVVISFILSVSIELYYKRNAVYLLPPCKLDWP